MARQLDRRKGRLFLTAALVETPAPAPTSWRLSHINRSRPLSLLLALAFPLIMIRSAQLLTYTQIKATFGLPMFRFGRFSPQIVGVAHRRPLEICPSINEAFERHVQSEPSPRPRGLWRLAAFAADYHRTSRAIMMGRCAGGWTWRPGSGGDLYAQFARDAPIAWIFGRLGGSEVLIALFLTISALLGTFGVGRLLFYLSESNAVVVAGLGLFAWTVASLVRIFHLDLLWAAYGLLTCWLVACWNRSSERLSTSSIVLSLALALHLCGYLVVAYSAAFGVMAVALASMACVLAARPSRSRAALFAIVTVSVWAVTADCAAFCRRQLAPITPLNFAGAGSFSEFALSTGFWSERPNPASFPLGDPGIYAAYRAEPMVRDYANPIFEYQGVKAFGQSLLRATVVQHPLVALESIGKRMFLVVVRLPVLAQPLMNISPLFIRTSQVAAAVTLILAIVVVLRGVLWPVALPMVAIPLWNMFGIESLTNIVHTHQSYHVFGMMQLSLLAPVLLVLASRVPSMGWPEWLRQPWRASVAFGLLLAVLGLAITGARRELATFDVWYQPWIGMYRAPEVDGLEPQQVRNRIEYLRSLGEATPGSISAYAAWMMSRLADNVWVPESGVGDKLHMRPETVEQRRSEARALAASYLHRALDEAPDNPWVGTFTEVWDQQAVAPEFERLLDRHPDHPFAPWWSYVLARRLSGPAQLRYANLFEQITHVQLTSTAALRPGFVATPAGGQPVGRSGDQGWTEVSIAAGETPRVVGAMNAFQSDRLRLIVDIRAVAGVARAVLVADTDAGRLESAEQRIAESDLHTYRVFQWIGASPARRMALQLRAAAGASAVVRVRDFYPMIENPHVDSLE